MPPNRITTSGTTWCQDVRRAQRRPSARLAVFVETPGRAHASPEPKQRLKDNLRFAEDPGAEVRRVRGAHERHVETLRIGHSRRGRLHELRRGSVVHSLPRLARGVDGHVVADRDDVAH